MSEFSEKPSLVVLGEDGEEETIWLSATTTLGRQPGNEVVIPEPEVSRQHAEVVETEEGYRLRDLGSTNGTFVNRQRITNVDYLLKDGDQINLGAAKRSLVFRLGVSVEREPGEVPLIKPEPELGEAAASENHPDQPTAPAPELYEPGATDAEEETPDPVEVEPLEAEPIPDGPAAPEPSPVEPEPAQPARVQPTMAHPIGAQDQEPGVDTELEETAPPTGAQQVPIEAPEIEAVPDAGPKKGLAGLLGRLGIAPKPREATADAAIEEAAPSTGAVSVPAEDPEIAPVPTAETRTGLARLFSRLGIGTKPYELSPDVPLEEHAPPTGVDAVPMETPEIEPVPGVETRKGLAGLFGKLGTRGRHPEVEGDAALKDAVPASSLPVPVEAQDLEIGPAVEPQTSLARLLVKLGVRKEAQSVEVVAAAPPAKKEEPEPALPLAIRIKRAYLNLREDLSLLRRRRVLTLAVMSGVVRALVIEGNEIVAWGKSDPREGQNFDEGEVRPGEGPEEFGTRLLLEDLRATRARLITELPLYTPLVRHLRLPELGRRYVDDVVSNEVSETIPFTQDEVDVKWRMVEAGEDRRAIAIAVQKQAVDAHVDRIRTAGARPTATYSEAAALAVAAGVPNAMVVHLTPEQEAVVLVRDAAPQVIHQVPAADEAQGLEGRVEAIARSVEQIEGFDQAAAEGEEGLDLPLVLTGEIPGDGRLEELLREAMRREVLVAAPPLEYPDGFPIAEYATNAGLGLLYQARSGGAPTGDRPSGASISLLSERHVQAPFPFVPIAAFVVLVLFAVTSARRRSGSCWPSFGARAPRPETPSRMP